MAAVAGGFVGSNGNAKIVNDVFLAQYLLSLWIDVFPLPVFGAMDLAGRFGMAGQTGFCHLGPTVERGLKFFEFAVVSGGVELEGLGILRGHK